MLIVGIGIGEKIVGIVVEESMVVLKKYLWHDLVAKILVRYSQEVDIVSFQDWGTLHLIFVLVHIHIVFALYFC